VTGGGSGIGFEIANQLGLHGASVFIIGRREAVLDAAVSQMRKGGVVADFCRGDVRDFESCKHAVETCVDRFGALTCLVNCAAGNFLAPAESITPRGFRVVMEIDAFGTFHMSTAAFPHLRDAVNSHGDANIINITAEFNNPPFFQLHAAAAKMAVNSMTKSFALEWADYGIRANGIAPGPIRNTTGMDKLGGMGGSDPEHGLSAMKDDLPRGLKLGYAWDIGMNCVYYCSAAGGYISGDISTVDGGFYLRNGLKVNKDGSLNVAAKRKLISQLSQQRERTQKKAATGVAGRAKI